MNFNGKIVGLIIGALIGYIPGALIGLFLGHLYDMGAFDNFLYRLGFRRGRQQTQTAFFNCTFAIMGYIAKSDGRVSENEIQAAKQIMDQMHLQGEARRNAIKQFYYGKSNEFDLYRALQELKQACHQRPMLLRSFLEIQVYIARAEGSFSPKKVAVLKQICDDLGIHGFNVGGQQYYQQHQNQQNHYQRQQYYQPNPQHKLNDAYTTLGVTKDASDADVKKAYRRLMSKHHPDRLIAQGVPPEMIKMATQKTQEIKEAYETIKTSRGIN